MGYDEQLTKFSHSLMNGDSHLKVYYRNRVLGVVERLKEAYPATFAHVGLNNFRFLCKKFLDDKGMRSPNIQEFLADFPEYLRNAEELHGEKGLCHLAKLDWLWFSAIQPGDYLELPEGIYFLWQSLVNENDFRGSVNFDKLERIQIIESEGDLNLMLFKI